MQLRLCSWNSLDMRHHSPSASMPRHSSHCPKLPVCCLWTLIGLAVRGLETFVFGFAGGTPICCCWRSKAIQADLDIWSKKTMENPSQLFVWHWLGSKQLFTWMWHAQGIVHVLTIREMTPLEMCKLFANQVWGSSLWKRAKSSCWRSACRASQRASAPMFTSLHTKKIQKTYSNSKAFFTFFSYVFICLSCLGFMIIFEKSSEVKTLRCCSPKASVLVQRIDGFWADGCTRPAAFAWDEGCSGKANLETTGNHR